MHKFEVFYVKSNYLKILFFIYSPFSAFRREKNKIS